MAVELSFRAGSAVAVPVRVTSCAAVLALEVILKVAFNVPVVVGLKETSTLQLELAARVVPQALRSSNEVELVPVTVMPLIVTVAVPVFLMVSS